MILSERGIETNQIISWTCNKPRNMPFQALSYSKKPDCFLHHKLTWKGLYAATPGPGPTLPVKHVNGAAIVSLHIFPFSISSSASFRACHASYTMKLTTPSAGKELEEALSSIFTRIVVRPPTGGLEKRPADWSTLLSLPVRSVLSAFVLDYHGS